MGRTLSTPPTATEAVAYYRVSTAKQGQSGLGLEAQRDAVMTFARARGLTIVAEFTEVETGTGKRNRPQLAAALAETSKRGARLIIAKLDRLARNVHFLTGLQDAHVAFTAVDVPEADEFTVQILAAVAQREAKLISTRTRDALAAAKRRGVKLGKPENLTPARAALGPAAMRATAAAAYVKLNNYITVMRDGGGTLRDVAAQLNADGYRTRTGAQFTAMTVKRMIDRMC